MNFHDPQTREQMEREGWRYVESHGMKSWFRKTIGARDIDINEDSSIDFIHDDDDYKVVSFPMKSFAAALNAANAILEGVEG